MYSGCEKPFQPFHSFQVGKETVMTSSGKRTGRIAGQGSEGAGDPSNPSKAVVARGAYPSRGRVSAAAKAQPASFTPAVPEPWADTGRCTIEALVNWAFGPQRVGASPVAGLCQLEAEAAGYAWQNASTDGVAAIERIGTVGCRIDISGPGRDVAHPIAELVAHVVAMHPEGEIVREWGKLGVRPGGWDKRPRFVPAMLRPDGEAEWIYDESRLPERTGRHCPLLLMNSVEAVNAARRMYLRWFDAMADIWIDVSAYAGLPFQLEPVKAKRVPWVRVVPDGA